jgi:hypothetical protein
MYSIIDIAREAAEATATFKIEKIEVVGGALTFQYKFYSCDLKTYWLKPCMKVIVDGATGKVQEVSNNKWVQIQFTRAIDESTKTFNLPQASFFHGTVPMADVEIKRACDLPICYLYELFTQQHGTIEDVNAYIAQRLRFFFMDDYPQDNNWLTDDHYQNVIYPMQNFAFFFIENLKANVKKVDENYLNFNRYDLINRVKTGVFKGTKGNEKSTFTRNLSGVELVISVAVKKDDNCGCLCCENV